MKNEIVEALSVFPERLKYSVLKGAAVSPEIYEIHLVAEKAVCFYTVSGIRFVTDKGCISLSDTSDMLVPYYGELDEVVNRATGFSGFLHERELKEGFVTYSGGIRMGICTCGSDENFSHGKINSLSIRIPMKENISFSFDMGELMTGVKNGLLIAGQPCSGKTTLLRTLARLLSDGKLGAYSKVAVIDERGELSGGKPMGFCTDVISGKEKSSAILHALRLCSPQYIICDEIGSVKEAKSIIQGLHSGVRFICSMHSGGISSLIRREQFRVLFRESVFDKVAILSPCKKGELSAVYLREEIENEIIGTCSSLLVGNDDGIFSVIT